jgi:NTP pyrophosphatase (non-canonical NTP hydrolase)
VTQNISDKYIELPELEPIAKVDFTILETPATQLYRGQHGFESEIWPIKHHLQKTREQLAGDPRLGDSASVGPRVAGSGMESLASLTRRQIEADRTHGFPVELPDDQARCNQLSKDLVGLMGEIGEFANLLKKVELAITQPAYAGPDLAAAVPELRMELADAQIYLLRLAHLIRVDLGEAVLHKMRSNNERYAYLKRN